MKIIESFVQSKNGNLELSEDGIFYNDDFVAVIDGCTNKSAKIYDKTPGRIAMEIIKKSISTFKKDITSKEAFKKISEDIKKWYISNSLLDIVSKEPEKRISAITVIYSNFYHQLWFVGDCQAIINNKKLYHFPLLIENHTSSLRSFLIYAELQKGKKEKDLLEKDIAREALLPIMANQVYLQNDFGKGPFAYSVCNGFLIRDNDIKVIQLEKEDTTIALSSDGYPQIKKSLEESEKNLEQILKKDPLLFRDFKATKGISKGLISFDDRSYVKFTVI